MKYVVGISMLINIRYYIDAKQAVHDIFRKWPHLLPVWYPVILKQICQ